MAELRNYDPSWREQIIAYLMGDQRPSPEKRRLVEGLMGGGSAPGLIDVTPAGVGLHMQERVQRGDGSPEQVAGTAVEGALMSVPFVGPAARAAYKTVPRAFGMATGLSGAGVLASQASAADKPLAEMTPQEVRKYQTKLKDAGFYDDTVDGQVGPKTRQADQIYRNAQRQSADQVAMKTAEIEATAKAERERAAQERNFALEDKKREAEAPFRDDYPDMNKWRQTIGMGASAVIAALVARGQNRAAAKLAEELAGTAQTARGHLAAGRLAEAQEMAPTLASLQTRAADAAAPSFKKSAAAAGAGVMGSEFAATTPVFYDRYALPPGSPEQKEAERKTTGMGLVETLSGPLVSGVLAGAGGAKIGSGFGKTPPPDVTGLRQRLDKPVEVLARDESAAALASAVLQRSRSSADHSVELLRRRQQVELGELPSPRGRIARYLAERADRAGTQARRDLAAGRARAQRQLNDGADPSSNTPYDEATARNVQEAINDGRVTETPNGALRDNATNRFISPASLRGR